MQNLEKEDDVLTPQDVCKILKICRSTFDRRTKAGQLKVVRHYRKIYVLRSDLLAQLSMSKAEQLQPIELEAA